MFRDRFPLSLAWLCLIMGAIFLPIGTGRAGEENALDHRIQPGEELLFKQVTSDGDWQTRVLIEGRVAVGADGEVELPNVGKIPVQGKTVREITHEFAGRFCPPGLDVSFHLALVPRVGSDTGTVDVSGGVAFPMKIKWYPGMNLQAAVELCGGLMPDAHAKKIHLVRASALSQVNFRSDAGKAEKVDPGDAIFVPVIFF